MSENSGPERGVALVIVLLVMLTLSALAMALTLVYTGEHYVVDVLAGWLVAIVGVGISLVVARLVRGPEASGGAT